MKLVLSLCRRHDVHKAIAVNTTIVFFLALLAELNNAIFECKKGEIPPRSNPLASKKLVAFLAH